MGKKYPGKIASAVVSAFSPEGQEAVKRHQLQKRHGVVALDALGNVVYRYDGHEITPEELEEAVGKLVR
jgi:hypothetical protein